MRGDLYRNVKRGRDPELPAALGSDPTPADEHVYGETSWDGGASWCRFAAWLPLMRIRMAVDESQAAAATIWPMSDYGTMGYDWSAIRDSSTATVRAMERVAERYVTDAALLRRLGLPE